MDNDQYGHMNNVVHYSLFDTAVSNWQMAQGVFNVTGEVTKFMVVESGCRYFDEAGYPDLIHVGLRLGHLGNSCCLLYTSPSPRDVEESRMPSAA